jgi:hypothetical protein
MLASVTQFNVSSEVDNDDDVFRGKYLELIKMRIVINNNE